MVYEIVDHTADIGIKLRAAGEKELFRDALKALFNIITGFPPEKVLDSSLKISRKRISIRKTTIEDSLINFLNKIIYLVDVYHILPFDVHIRFIKHRIIAKLFCIMSADSIIEREVKAATFHNLHLIRGSRELKVQIIFDV